MKYDIFMTLLTTNYGENFAKWSLDQIFWLALVAGIAVAAFAFVKKSWVGGIITAIATAIICYFVKNPTKLTELGTSLAEMIGF